MTGKPFKTLDELVALLTVDRGLSCDNPDELREFLSRTNYYRLSGYARQFQVSPRYGDNRFVQGSSFEQIRMIMSLDDELRSHLMQSLAVVEIGIRAALAYQYGKTYGATAFYLDTDFYRDEQSRVRDIPLDIVKGIIRDFSRSRSPMLQRYVGETKPEDNLESQIAYYSKVPIWVAVELVSFGKISNMLSNYADIAPAKEAAKSFEIQWDPFASTVHALHYLRNMCAHHRQLWNRRPDVQCTVQKKQRPRRVSFELNSFYSHIIMLNLYRKKLDGDSDQAEAIARILDSSQIYGKGIMDPRPK